MRANPLNTPHRASAFALLGVAGLAACALPARAQTGGGYDLSWSAIDCGGDTSPSTGGVYSVAGTIGQPDTGQMTAPSQFMIIGGFWSAIAPDTCYANCDGSTTAPILNIADFTCFINRFSAGDSYANCDGSTAPPVLNISDFTCFLNAFAAGCP